MHNSLALILNIFQLEKELYGEKRFFTYLDQVLKVEAHRKWI